MQNKLRQLVISALMRNEATAELLVNISLRGYHITVKGEVPSQRHQEEVIQTIQSVSPLLRVDSHLTISDIPHTANV